MNFVRAYSWAILWALLMLFLMLKPSNELPVTDAFPGFDKMAHCGFFFVLSTLLYLGASQRKHWRASKWLTILKIILVTMLFAFFTEAAQYYLSPSRSADWWDIFADAVGIGMASFAYMLIYRRERY